MTDAENQKAYKMIEDAETYRQSLTPQEQADFMRAAYQEITEDDRESYFMLVYNALQRVRRRSFTILQGGRA